jgi:hypothetical protein
MTATLTSEIHTRASRQMMAGTDPALLLPYWQADPLEWIQTCLEIRTKKKTIIPFLPNEPQQDYYRHQTRKDMILKARQMGFTTLICAEFFADTVLNQNTTSVIVAHDSDSTQRIFQIVKLFWERLADSEKARIGEPQYSNRREFFWPKINSWFYVGTAGSASFGRGQTVNNLHCSELAFWPDPENKLVALLEAVPTGGRVVLESTPNGMGNYFHDLWVAAQAGENDFAPHFYDWHWDGSNKVAGEPLAELTAEEIALRDRWQLSDAQIRWRREKQRSLRALWVQEHPEDSVSCFLASGGGVFDPDGLKAQLDRIAGEDSPDSWATLSWQGRRQQQNEDSIALAPATLTVWQRPQAGRRYVIGADVAEGLQNGDASSADVLDWESGEQVAQLHGRIRPERFAYLLAALGYNYNNALLGVERENHGHSTLNTLRNVLRYPKLYQHVAYDKKQKDGGKERVSILGWPTTSATKPVLVDDLAGAIAEGNIIIRSRATIDECFTFITEKNGSQGAQQGKFDDRVMSLGIAWQIRKRVARVGNASMEIPNPDVFSEPTFGGQNEIEGSGGGDAIEKPLPREADSGEGTWIF